MKSFEEFFRSKGNGFDYKIDYFPIKMYLVSQKSSLVKLIVCIKCRGNLRAISVKVFDIGQTLSENPSYPCRLCQCAKISFHFPFGYEFIICFFGYFLVFFFVFLVLSSILWAESGCQTTASYIAIAVQLCKIFQTSVLQITCWSCKSAPSSK